MWSLFLPFSQSAHKQRSPILSRSSLSLLVQDSTIGCPTVHSQQCFSGSSSAICLALTLLNIMGRHLTSSSVSLKKIRCFSENLLTSCMLTSFHIPEYGICYIHCRKYYQKQVLFLFFYKYFTPNLKKSLLRLCVKLHYILNTRKQNKNVKSAK